MRAIMMGFLFFLLWATFARWYYVCKIKGQDSPLSEAAKVFTPPTTLGIYHSDSLLVKGFEQFVFDQSSIRPKLTSNNSLFLHQLLQELQERNALEVRITGFFLESEQDIRSNFYANLGEARAAGIQEWLLQQNISPERIHLRAKMAEGQRLIEPLHFYFFSPSTETIEN